MDQLSRPTFNHASVNACVDGLNLVAMVVRQLAAGPSSPFGLPAYSRTVERMIAALLESRQVSHSTIAEPRPSQHRNCGGRRHAIPCLFAGRPWNPHSWTGLNQIAIESERE